MQITRKSMLSGIERTREIDVTQEQLNRWIAGAPIQNVMHHLSADDREFIKTGITAEEWEEMHIPDDEDDEDNPDDYEEFTGEDKV